MDGDTTALEWTFNKTHSALAGVEICHSQYAHAFPVHVHSEYVVACIQEGVGAFHHGRSELAALQGELILLNPYDEHTGFCIDRPWMSLTANLDIDGMRSWLGDASESLARFKAPVANDTRVTDLIAALYAGMRSDGSALDLQSLAGELVLRLSDRHQKGGRKEDMHEGAVRRARQVLDDDPLSDIDLKELAALCDIRPLTLLRAFRRSVGCTPHMYRMRKRVDFAKQALRNRQPLAQIAQITGFYDQSHFTRVFRDWTSVTPGSYTSTLI